MEFLGEFGRWKWRGNVWKYRGKSSTLKGVRTTSYCPTCTRLECFQRARAINVRTSNEILENRERKSILEDAISWTETGKRVRTGDVLAVRILLHGGNSTVTTSRFDEFKNKEQGGKSRQTGCSRRCLAFRASAWHYCHPGWPVRRFFLLLFNRDF